MGRASRDKGKAAERDVVNRFKARGIRARRIWEDQSKPGGQVEGDIEIAVAVPPYIEVRRRETLDIPGWIREIEGTRPERALIFRRSREDWHVAIPLDYYIDLLEK